MLHPQQGLCLQLVHDRAQQLLTFFVDGATPLDQSEEGWDLLLAVKSFNNVLALVRIC